jgi:hypothetical protein
MTCLLDPRCEDDRCGWLILACACLCHVCKAITHEHDECSCGAA